MCKNLLPDEFCSQLFIVLGIYNFGSRRYGRNYDLFYVSTEAGRGCGGTLYNTRGVVTSPDYPRPHAQASNCEWTLKVPPGQRIQLRFAGKYIIHITVKLYRVSDVEMVFFSGSFDIFGNFIFEMALK